MALSKEAKKTPTKKAAPKKSASKQAAKPAAKAPAPKPAPQPADQPPALQATDWEQVKKELRSADDSLSASELDLLVSILSSPRRKRGVAPNAWLDAKLRSLIA